MLIFFLIWLALNVIALWITSYRLDSEACYDAILNYIYAETLFASMINIIVTFIILPLTIPKNIYHLFK